MVHGGSRQLWATLAAVAVLGLPPLCSLPVQGQVPSSTHALLATMKPERLRAGGGVYYSRLAGGGVYLVMDGESSRPVCAVLCNAAPERLQGAEMKALAERFQKAYALWDYRVSVAADASAAFLFRHEEEEFWSSKGPVAQMALSDASRVAPAVIWLSNALGGAPQRLEGAKLVWRKEFKFFASSCAIEATLNLLQGAPCCVDIRMEKILESMTLGMVERYLGLSLRAPARQEANFLRRTLGAHNVPVGLLEEKRLIAGKKRKVSYCLVCPGNESGTYSLGEVATLRKYLGSLKSQPPLPEVEDMPWADGGPGAFDPPAPSEKAEEPAPAEPQAESAPAPRSAAPVAPTMPTAAEARKAYTERLRSR